jgi:ABC-type branched-subunit amino acid transport system ATPase component
MTSIDHRDTPPALQTRGLCKQFGALPAAQSIDFVLPQGARHALIGPNGAGKTTFLNLITGMLRPDAGAIHLLGRDITALRADGRVRQGLVRTFQRASLFPALTPLESVILAICERMGSTADWRRHAGSYRVAVDEAFCLLHQLRLDHLAERPTATLAYGQQRILEVALALALRPRVLLLDEPAAGIPAEDSAELFEVIAGLPPELSLLFIEHDMDLVFRFATQVTVMMAGRIVAEGPPGDIAANPQVQAIYLGSAAGQA